MYAKFGFWVTYFLEKIRVLFSRVEKYVFFDENLTYLTTLLTEYADLICFRIFFSTWPWDTNANCRHKTSETVIQNDANPYKHLILGRCNASLPQSIAFIREADSNWTN